MSDSDDDQSEISRLEKSVASKFGRLSESEGSDFSSSNDTLIIKPTPSKSSL
jgi:hypothetical protein